MAMVTATAKKQTGKNALKPIESVRPCSGPCAIAAQTQDRKRVPVSIEDLLCQKANSAGKL